MSKESRLMARLKAMTGLTALVSTRIWPVVVPEGQELPAVVYELTSETKEDYNTAGGRGKTRMARFRIRALVEVTEDESGYLQAVSLADAIIGDEAATSPNGLSGWQDADNDLWFLDDVADEPGAVMTEGVYMRVLDFHVAYSK